MLPCFGNASSPCQKFSCQEAKAARTASSKRANKCAGRRAAATNNKASDNVSAAQPPVETAIVKVDAGWGAHLVATLCPSSS